MRKEEIGKYLVKIQLCEARDREFSQIGPLGKIEQIGEVNEYNALPEGFSSFELATMSDEEILDVVDEVNIKTSIYRSSADVFINNVGYKIINLKLDSNPIIKTMTRDKIEPVTKKFGKDISVLDEAVAKYWKLRENGSIGEEIQNNNANSPFKNLKEEFRELIEYFLFDGDEKGEFSKKAENLLFFSKPLSQSNWNIVTREKAVDNLWKRMNFSIKHQGMPSKYPNIAEEEALRSIDKWTSYVDGFYLGALNIRI